MASTSHSEDKVADSLSSLTLDTDENNRQPTKEQPKAKAKAKAKAKLKLKSKKKVVDSWEDDDSSSASDAEQRIAAVTSPVVPSAPPPTPFTANYEATIPDWKDITDGPASPRGGPAAKRPEKTDAVARRMIAAGLGLKAAKQTEEQRAYQKSVREQEKKRREQEREEEQRRHQESEMAKAAVWED